MRGGGGYVGESASVSPEAGLAGSCEQSRCECWNPKAILYESSECRNC